jgi:hypothetical protein
VRFFTAGLSLFLLLLLFLSFAFVLLLGSWIVCIAAAVIHSGRCDSSSEIEKRMEVFIHEDYVNKRNELRREQRRRELQRLQVESNPDASREALASRESPRTPAQCLTPTGASPSSFRSPTSRSTLQSPAAAAGQAAGWPSEHRRLYDCLKPY